MWLWINIIFKLTIAHLSQPRSYAVQILIVFRNVINSSTVWFRIIEQHFLKMKRKIAQNRHMVNAKLLWFPFFGVFGIRQIPPNRLFPGPIRPVDVPRYSGSVQIHLMSIWVGRWSVEQKSSDPAFNGCQSPAVSSLIKGYSSRAVQQGSPALRTIDMSYLTDGSTHTLTSAQTQRGLNTHSSTNIKSHALKIQTYLMSVASKQAHTRTCQEGFYCKRRAFLTCIK